METTSRFKGLDLGDRVPEELWTDIQNTVQEVVTKTIPPEKEMQDRKVMSEEVLQIADKRREAKGKENRERYTQLNSQF